MMMAVAPTAPDKPAARAKGTVKPSDMPITMSRTVSEAVKCFSTCGVCGMGVLLVQPVKPFVLTDTTPTVASIDHERASRLLQVDFDAVAGSDGPQVLEFPPP